MNPYIISTIIGTIKGLRRTCPKCGHTQIVPADKKNQTVPCSHCGADIPPKKKKSAS
jgi:ribosomal protein S27E